jgi:hypothetical protein
MNSHLLYLRLSGAERFHGMHGGPLAAAAREALARRFADIARELLRPHLLLSEPQSPFFGVWLAPFMLSRLEIDSGEAEQLASIVRAGRELARTALEDELGPAIALGSRFDVGTLAIDESSRDASEWLTRLDAPTRAASEPSAARR